MSVPLLSRLRQSTAAAHDEIEKSLEMEHACRDLGKYREVLAGFLGYYEPVEAHLKGFENRIKSPWLRNDLGALGYSSTEIEAMPRCDHLPRLDTEAEILGCAYVLEGATLGGRQISAWLEHSEIPQQARTFFASYGEEVRTQWKAFCLMLENFEAAGGPAEDVVSSANATFLTLNDWMTKRKETP